MRKLSMNVAAEREIVCSAVPLLKQFGLCAEHIVEVAEDFCK